MSEHISKFPSENVSDAEKNSEEYGLKIGNAIEAEWWSDGSDNGRYEDFQQEFHRLRRYARGEQSIQKYKDEFKTNGDLSYINLDWKPVPIIPKFKDIVVNGMNHRLFDISVNAIDPTASKERGKEVKRLERDMISKRYEAEIIQATGASPLQTPADQVPDSQEELDLYMNLNYKQGVEIAEEQAIDFVFKKEEFDLLRKRLLEDLTICGIGAAKHSYNNSEGITLDYVDPADLIWSYSDNDPYFRDAYYWGEIRKGVTITQLKKEFPDLSEADIKKLVQAGKSTKQDTWGTYGANDNDNDSNIVEVVYFTFKTFNNSVYKKKSKPNGGMVAKKVDDSFQGPKHKDAKFEKVQITREVLYEGAKVLGADVLLKWQLAENMVRPKANTSKVMPPYIVHAPSIYNGRIESLVQRMTSYADLIQLTHLKLQQAAQKMVPDGVIFDPDAFSEIDLGNGTTYSPQEAMNMYWQTGSIVGRSMTVTGDPNRSPAPLTPIQGNNASGKFEVLIGLYNHYLNMIRDVTGLNEASDGSTPSEYALPGVQKLAAANSNTATKHILEGSLYITKQLAYGVSNRIADVLEFSPTKQEFVQAIGRFATANLKDISKLHLHNFGIFIKLHPDEEERAVLDNNISIALQQQDISAADVIDIQQITNINLASQLLKLRRKKHKEAEQKRQQELAQQQAQANAQAAQQAAEAEAQAETIKAQAMIQIEEAKHKFGMEKLQREVDAKKELMHVEFQYKQQMAQEAGQAAQNKFQQGEDRKDQRQREAASQNSKMIEQRNTSGPAYDFESLAGAAQNREAVDGSFGGGAEEFESAGNDNLSNIGDLAQFDPK